LWVRWLPTLIWEALLAIASNCIGFGQ